MNCDHCGAPISDEAVLSRTGHRFCTPLHRFLWQQEHPEEIDTSPPAQERRVRQRSPAASDSLVVFRILLGLLYIAAFYFASILGARVLIDWLANSPTPAEAIRGIATTPTPGEAFTASWGWLFLFAWIAFVIIAVNRGWLPGTKAHPTIDSSDNDLNAGDSK